MKTLDFIIGIIPTTLETGTKTVEMNSLAWYTVGALIAFLLLAYLMYSLVKPEKF